MKRLFWSKPLVLLIILFAFLPWTVSTNATADNSFISGSFTNDAGSRDYKLFIPSGYRDQSVYLVVMLHGCGQNPDDFAAGTKMNEIAERETFLVLYPEQSSDANTNKCWNWFEPEHQERGKGEPSIIADLTKSVIADYKINQNKVYIAGMSAGGAMTTLVGAAYPDIFAAIGVGAGLEYKAATNLLDGLTAMQIGGPDPLQQGSLAFLNMKEKASVIPVILFHGDADAVVNVKNGHQTILQWAQTNDLSDDGLNNDSIKKEATEITNGKAADGFEYEIFHYQNSKSKTIMEKWIVKGMEHKWSGGSLDGSHTDPKGPDASEEMIRFFLEHPKNTN